MKYKPEYSPSNEVHITSVLVQVAPIHMAQTCEKISKMDGAEIHVEGEGGKLIVSFEADALNQITQYIDEIALMQGVASATLIYHQCENADEMDELVEIDPEELFKHEQQNTNGNLS